MNGVVSLLDPEHYALTEALWAELAGALGLRGVYATPYPHFSYHVAAGYDRARLQSALQQATAGAQAFMVTTAGLGVFTGPAPVLYLPVVRTPELSAFHARLWPALEAAATGSVPYYAPPNWVPHITLGFGDLTPATLAQALTLLGGRDFNWEIHVDNLAYVDDADGQPSLAQKLFLGNW